MRKALPAFLLPLLLLSCAAEPNDNVDPDLAGEKSDSLFEAIDIGYGQTKEGNVSGRAFTLYKLSAQKGDLVQVSLEKNSGDFEPRSVFYNTELIAVSHERGSFQESEDGNIKVFKGRGDGDHFIVVRANRFVGEGEFTINLECIGGPCSNPAPSPNNFDATAAGICMTKARECAIDELHETSVENLEQGLALLAQCLESSGDECGGLCELEEIDSEGMRPRDLCFGIAQSLPFYSAQDEECRQFVQGCFNDCTNREENSPFLEEDEFEFWMTGEAICWEPELTSNCDDFAQQHEVCGGEDFGEIDGMPTLPTCTMEQEVTAGAWGDSDDGLGCVLVCDDIQDQCEDACSGSTEEDCFESCVFDHDLVGDADFSEECFDPTLP